MIGILGAGALIFGMEALFKGASNGSSMSVTNDITTRVSNMVINKNINRNTSDTSTQQTTTIDVDGGGTNLDAKEKCQELLDAFESDFLEKFGTDIATATLMLQAVNYPGYTNTNEADEVIHSLDTGLNADAYTIESNNIGTHLWCKPVQNSGVVDGVTQSVVFRSNSIISSDVNIVNDIQNSVQGHISSSLTNDVDLPGGWLDSLNGNTQSISSQYATSISNIIEQINTNENIDNKKIEQNITISGHSFVATNIMQNAQVESNFVSQSIVNYNNSLKNSVEYQILQALENKNNTTQELADGIDAAFSDAAGLVSQGVTQITILGTIIVGTGIAFTTVRQMHNDWEKERIAVIEHNKPIQKKPIKRILTSIILVTMIVLLVLILGFGVFHSAKSD